MNEPQVIKGTREEVGEHLKLFSKEQRFRLKPDRAIIP